MAKKPLILVSNDDGVHAPGLKALVQQIKTWAELVVVAPESEQSASSHSLTLHRPLRIRKLKKNTYAVNGTPTDCVTLGIHQIMPQKPDLILSGVNNGANLGDDVHYSGTVSAAMEGAIHGIPAVAVSLARFDEGKIHFKTAAEVALRFCKKIFQRELPTRTLFNINVPNVPIKDLKGKVVTRLGRRNYGDIIVEKTDPRGRQYYWIGGNQTGFYDIKGSDCMAIAEQKVSITPLKPDLTHQGLLKEMRQWSRL